VTTPDSSKPGVPAEAGLTPLLGKDLAVFSRRDRIIVFGAFFLAALQTVPNDEAFFLIAVALAGALIVYVPVVEWFQDTDPMLHSLPARRATVVLARYVSALAGLGLAGIAWVSAGWLLGTILDAHAAGPALWGTFEGLVTFSVSICFLVSLFLPFHFRMGMGRGSLAFLGLVPVLLIAGYGTAGVAWGPASGGASGVAGLPLFPPSSLVSSRISALVGAVGPGWALAAIIVAMGSILAFSERLSVRWLKSREF
jgi:hypothetical protein